MDSNTPQVPVGPTNTQESVPVGPTNTQVSVVNRSAIESLSTRALKDAKNRHNQLAELLAYAPTTVAVSFGLLFNVELVLMYFRHLRM